MLRKIKNFYHLVIAILANFIFAFPAKDLTVIGVTGTDGKTTTVNLIYHILKESGKNVSMLTSIGAFIGDKEFETGFHVTTPSSILLQKFLRYAIKQKSEYFVLEVTSHALDQHRTFGIPFKIGVLTNITSEHLDYHKTYEEYLKTKEKLLKVSETAIVNADDSSYALLSESKKQKEKKNWITYGFSKTAEVSPINFKFESKRIKGDFNKYNVLASVACVRQLGISEEGIKKAINNFKMPLGRFDFIYDEEFSVVIDFAHTPNAFEQILGELRDRTTGKIIHIFGSAGQRDSAKRPLMGEISSKYADIIILTAEDPRSEDVGQIISEIVSGIKSKDVSIFRIANRKEAIAAGIEMAGKNDLVIITGKAHEKSMTYGNKDILWDEYKAVDDALKSKK